MPGSFEALEIGCKCNDCPFSKSAGKPPIIPRPKPRAQLALIDEAPKTSEFLDKDFFGGRKQQFLRSACERLNIHIDELYLTSALLCSIPKESESADIAKAIECCSSGRLTKELTNYKVAMPLGNLALQAISTNKSISNYHGAPQLSPFFKDLTYIPSFHPRFVLSKPYYTPVFLIHLQRTYDCATQGIPEWKWPKLVSSFHEPELINKTLGELLASPEAISCDVETTIKDSENKRGTPRTVKLLNIGFANDKVMLSIDTSEGLHKLAPATVNLLKFVFKRKRLIFQNGIFDIQVLVANKLIESLERLAFDDTMIMHAICAPNLPHSLAFICGVEFPAPRWKEEFGAAKGATDDMSDKFANADPSLRALYNARDNYMQFILWQKLSERINTQVHNGPELYNNRLRLAKIAVGMTIKGVKVSQSNRLKHLNLLRAKVADAHIKLASLVGDPEFNPNATRQVTKWMLAFGAPILKVTGKTKEPAYTGDILIQLTSYPDEKISTFASLILKYRKYNKLLSTYVDKLPIEVDANGVPRVHPTWNVIGARSGRWAAKKPNLMNVPKPSKVKLKSEVVQLPGMRDIFEADENQFLVEFDASALELRNIALLAQDTQLIKDFEFDLHTINAAMLFNKLPTLLGKHNNFVLGDDCYPYEVFAQINYVTDKERDFAKRFVYGSNYGGGAATIWKSMVVDFPSLSIRDIERALKMWAKARPLVAAWKANQIIQAGVVGFAEDVFSGRRCVFYGNFEPTKALNYPIQMLAIYILDLGLLKIKDKLAQFDATLLMQVHDSLVFQTSKPIELYKFLEKELYIELTYGEATCPYPFEGKIGKDWGNMKKLKEAIKEWGLKETTENKTS